MPGNDKAKEKIAQKKAKGLNKLQSIMDEMDEEEVTDTIIRMRAKLKRIKAGKE